MYNVQAMRRYTAAQARQRFAELLDAAERGDAVVVERRGIRFRLRAERGRPRRAGRRTPLIEHVDPAVARGDWTWRGDADGLRFVPRPRRR
jgi:antitoxin (DNA-binding transcriptional repressor) of toxin-antitoxin stability system